MASELRVNTLKDASGNNSIATSFVAGGGAKAWSIVDNDQSTSNDSFNVSSHTDEGTGESKRNLTSALSSNPFTHCGVSITQHNAVGFNRLTDTSTASSVQTSIRNSANSSHDKSNSLIVTGDLA